VTQFTSCSSSSLKAFTQSVTVLTPVTHSVDQSAELVPPYSISPILDFTADETRHK